MRVRGFAGGYRRITAIERDAAGSRTGQAGAFRTGDDGRSPALSCRQSRPHRCSLASAVAPHPRLADLGADIRAPGLGLGAGGNVSRRRLVHGLAQHGAVGGAFLKPNFHDWDHYVADMIVTVQIAIWGTALAVLFGIPFSILSASNICPQWIVQPTRRLMDACRAINEIVFALMFVVAVGLGPFAGVMAIFVH